MQQSKMKPLLLLQFLQLLFLSSTGFNTLYPNQSLSIGQNLTSPNGIFQFGFVDTVTYFPHIPSYAYDYCIGIWYSKLPSQTLVWCNPCALRQLSGLTITINGYLEVLKGVLMWSTPDFNSTKLVLEDTGNLVLASISNNSKVLWQSFDHPTDTWLPGAKLGFNKLTKSGQVYGTLVTEYSFELDPGKMGAILLKKDTTYGTCRVKGSSFTCSLNLDSYTVESEFLLYKGTNLSYISTENEEYYTYTVTNSTTLTRFVISDNGSVIQVKWSEDHKDWMPSKLKLFHIHCNQVVKENHEKDTLQSCITDAPPATDETPKSDTITAPLPHRQQDSGTKPKSKVSFVILGVTSGSISLMTAITLLILKRKSKKKRQASKPMETSFKVFKYSDLRNATKNFTTKLGEGGFGSVYKGTLPNSSRSIAVKKLKDHVVGEKQFRAEICTLGVIHHVNLVLLQGFCVHGTKKLLVYDYLPNGSVDKHLFGCNSGNLDWSTRYKIALGVAKGLAYLHNECREQIIHCDIKPENILLDEAFNPKIADFGLAKLLGRDFSRVLTTMRGTRGYLAPEWIYGTEITAKADVYSYGMMLFEIISGKRNWSSSIDGEDDDYAPHRVVQRLNSGGDTIGLLDCKLEGNADIEELNRACKVAGWCIQDDEHDRPLMTQIVQILEGISKIDIPPMPRFLQYVVDVPEE